MATTTLEHAGAEHGGSRTEKKIATGGPVLELIAGAGAIVLPILGLVGVLPMILAAIAFIAIGGGLMMQGGGVALYTGAGAHAGSTVESGEMIGGMSAEMLGGAAVTALGILAAVGVSPMTLMATASIVAGGALTLGAGTTARIANYRYGDTDLDERKRAVLHESVNAAAGADVLVGLGAIVLGILVLAGVGSLPTQRTLALVAALSLGGALFFNGTTVGARFASLLRH